MDPFRDLTEVEVDEYGVMDTIYRAYAAYRLIIQPELNWVDKVPCRTSKLGGAEWVNEMLAGHPTRIQENLKLSKDSFLRLCQILREGRYVKSKPQCQVSVEEGLAIFLWTIARSHWQCISAERFQHSTETINRQSKRMIRALVNFAPNIIRLRNSNAIHSKILNDRRFYPWFEGAIGALDGTEISAWARSHCLDAFRNRKSHIAQNVLAACDHDMRFTFVHVGWEGSANDGRVFTDALTNGQVKFPRAPDGKYYLVDSAFANMEGFLAPYRGEQYHDYSRGHRYRSKRELFNHRHASLRNVIECMFGVFKKRWPIAKGPMPNYKMARQGQIVIALCVLHNFIRETSLEDSIFAEFENQELVVGDEDNGGEQDPTAEVEPNNPSQAEWAAFRDSIADNLWAAYHG